MKEFIKMGSRCPTAIFVASDIQAVGALAALRESDLHCPDDVAIVGFDDIILASSLELTTVRQPMYEMGSLAVERLMSRMQQPEQPPAHMTFTPKLIMRRTCGSTVSSQSAKVIFSEA